MECFTPKVYQAYLWNRVEVPCFMFTRILSAKAKLVAQTDTSIITSVVTDPYEGLIDHYRFETVGRYARYSRI